MPAVFVMLFAVKFVVVPRGRFLQSQNAGIVKSRFALCPHLPLAVQASRVPEVVFATESSII